MGCCVYIWNIICGSNYNYCLLFVLLWDIKMTMSKGLREAYKHAEEIEKTLLATDPRFNQWVRVDMEDGSCFTINAGFAEKHGD